MMWRKWVGIALIISAIFTMGGGWYVFAQSQSSATRTQQAWDQADRQCINALGGVGEVEVSGPLAMVAITLEDGRGWQSAMADATGLISYCATRRLTRFCMGRGCDLAASLPTEGITIPQERLIEVRAAPLKVQFQLREVRP